MRVRSCLIIAAVLASSIAIPLGIGVSCVVGTTPPSLAGLQTARQTSASVFQDAVVGAASQDLPVTVAAPIRAVVEKPALLATISSGRGDSRFGYLALTTMLPTSPGASPVQITEHRFGWPLPVLSAWTVYTSASDGSAIHVAVGGSMVASSPPFLPKVTPHSVMWANLMLQAALIGGSILGALVLVRWVRSARARRRDRLGQCVNCGHTLSGSAKCQECGRFARPA